MRSGDLEGFFFAYLHENHEALLASLLNQFREAMPGVSFAGHVGFVEFRPLAVGEFFFKPVSSGRGVFDKTNGDGGGWGGVGVGGAHGGVIFDRIAGSAGFTGGRFWLGLCE